APPGSRAGKFAFRSNPVAAASRKGELEVRSFAESGLGLPIGPDHVCTNATRTSRCKQISGYALKRHAHTSGRGATPLARLLRPGGRLAQRAVESSCRVTRKTSRSESSAAVCRSVTPPSQVRKTSLVDRSDVAIL